MTKANVNLTFLRRIKEAKTGKLHWKSKLLMLHLGVAIIMLNRSGENAIVIIGNANRYYPNPSILHPEYMKAIDSSKWFK